MDIHSPSLGYGLSLFETIKLKEGKPEFLAAHIQRINGSLKVLGSEKCLEILRVKKDIHQLTEAFAVKEGAIKLMVMDLGEGDHVLLTYSPRVYQPWVYEKGFSLRFAKSINDEQNVLTYHKTSNYGNKIIELRLGKQDLYDEVLFLNSQGCITEGATTNVFLVKEDKVYTPSQESGLLCGIMRQAVIELLRDMGKEVVVGTMEKDFYLGCKEVFVTNSLMWAMPVRQIENTRYDIRENHTASQMNKQLRGKLQNSL